MAYSAKPKTQRMPKKKPQATTLQKAKLMQKVKPQPTPKKPRVIQTTRPVVKKQMKPMRQPMVESKQTPKPLAGTMRTNDTSMVSKGRVTRQQLLNQKMKSTKNKMMRRMKPIRGGL
tara:strand:- start:2781 stop:3131 length:351 start_codon:yes stop_codon:yes gene_type:complete